MTMPRLGRTPLHYAASQKTGLSYITNLLKAGANIDHQDHSGMSPLHLACRSALGSKLYIVNTMIPTGCPALLDPLCACYFVGFLLIQIANVRGVLKNLGN